MDRTDRRFHLWRRGGGTRREGYSYICNPIQSDVHKADGGSPADEISEPVDHARFSEAEIERETIK